MTLPAFNTGLANLMHKRSKLTMLNNYQLDLFEQFIKAGEWNYDTVTMQEIEADQGPTYDFICMSLHDVIHNPNTAVNFFNRLNKNGTLMMLYTGMDSLYQDESIFTEIYQVHQVLKNIDNSGAILVTCIGCLSGGYKQRYAYFGDIITVSVQKLRKRRRTLVKVKKGQVLKALLIRTKKKLAKRSNLFFFENSVILLNQQKKLIGTRIFGSIPKILRISKYLRVTFLARGLIL